MYRYITQLNKDADEYTTYKVVYIARHGEGYHNQVSWAGPTFDTAWEQCLDR